MKEINLAGSEAAIIGGLFIDNSAIDFCHDLKPSMFECRKLGLIYKHTIAMISEGTKTDGISLSDHLKTIGLLDDVGGQQTILQLWHNTPSAAMVGSYVKAVRSAYTVRMLADVGHRIHTAAINGTGRDADELLSDALQMVSEIDSVSDIIDDETKDAVQSVEEFIQTLQRRMEMEDGQIGGLSTGLKALDEQIDGLHNGALIVIGGRPGMGKSILGEMIARTNASRGLSVFIQSYEMNASEIVSRGISASQSIPMDKITKANLTSSELDLVTQHSAIRSGWKMTISTASVTADRLIAKAKAHKRKNGLDLLVIDHLHLMPLENTNNAVAEIGKITASLKRAAMEMQIPIVLLAQLNRGSAGAVVRQPTLTDLRASGGIEQDANIVLLLHRPGYYDDQANPSDAEIIVAKNRNGAVGTIACGWRGDCVRFQDFPDSDYNPPARRTAYSYDE